MESVSPFANLPELPCDVAEALEQFKLAIIRHRSMDWGMIGQDEMESVCRALTQFADNPPPRNAPEHGDLNDEFESYLSRYINEHPSSDVRFAARMIRHDYRRIHGKVSNGNDARHSTTVPSDA